LSVSSVQSAANLFVFNKQHVWINVHVLKRLRDV
jgi:hypothetical protein